MPARALLVMILLIAWFNPGWADDQKTAQSVPTSTASEKKAAQVQESTPSEKLSVTQHSIRIGGETLTYTATAGTLPLKDDSGKPRAELFFVAYTKHGTDAASERPITFAFNGGPGASSVWLHLGAIGPWRVVVPDAEGPSLPPYTVVDNIHTWLAFTDLVFIDPIGTGLSRPAPGESAKGFYGTTEDIQSVGEFIRLVTTRFGRWSSPKFLAGESYGTLRAVGLTEFLHDRYGMDFNGLVLISLAIDFQTFSFDPANDLPHALFLPVYTATAWYHRRLEPELQKNLQETLDRAEQWAMSDYLVALGKGDGLQGAERERVVASLARFTGLPEIVIENNNLRIRRHTFMNELLREENRSVGLMDGRATRPGRAEGIMNDPSLAVTIGPYVAALNQTLKETLEVESDTPYIFLSEDANSQWNWGPGGRGYVSVLDTLQETMTRSPSLDVFVACGTYDLNTPCLAAEYSITHLGLAPELQKNIVLQSYEAGHMFYTHEASLKKLTADVFQFMKQAVTRP